MECGRGDLPRVYLRCGVKPFVAARNVAGGTPRKNLEGKINEIEDAIRLSAQEA